MEDKIEMTTLTSVLEKLRVKKMDNEFIMSPEGFGIGNNKYYHPEDLKIIRNFRFEGDSNPSDNAVLYLIEAKDGLIGYSLDSYGAYSDHDGDGYDDFIRNIKVDEREETAIFSH